MGSSRCKNSQIVGEKPDRTSGISQTWDLNILAVVVEIVHLCYSLKGNMIANQDTVRVSDELLAPS